MKIESTSSSIRRRIATVSLAGALIALPPAANQYQNSNTPPADSYCYSCGDGGGGGG